MPTFLNTDLTPVRIPSKDQDDTKPATNCDDGGYVGETLPKGNIEPESYEAPVDIRRDNPPSSIQDNPPPTQLDNPPDLIIQNLDHSPRSSFNSLNFDRFQGTRLSENSVGSSKRNSPSEPLIKSVTMSTPVDV